MPWMGTLTLTANGDYRVAATTLPVVGTLTVEFTSNSWDAGGAIVPQVRLADGAGAWNNTIYQVPGTSGDIAAGTTITGNKLIYVRLDGTELNLNVSGFVSGSMTVNWKWGAG